MGLHDQPQIDANGSSIRYAVDSKVLQSVPESQLSSSIPIVHDSLPTSLGTDRPYYQGASSRLTDSPVSPLHHGIANMSVSDPVPTQQVLNLSDSEQDLLAKANAKIAGWQQRLSQAYEGALTLNCDMVSVLALAKDRSATLKNLAIDSATVISSAPFLESLIQAFETFSLELIAKSIVLESVKKLTIINSGMGSSKSISYHPEMSELIFAGKFEVGDMYDVQEIKTLVAHLLRMSERWLSSFFTHSLLPAFQDRINVAFGKVVPIVFDIDTMLKNCHNPENQLKILQTITYETGITRQFWQLSDSSGRKLAQLIDRMRGKNAKEHRAEQIKDDLALPINERLDSPNVLLPMMFAFEKACETPSVAQVLRDTISEIHFRMIPGYNPDAKSLAFYRSLSEPPVLLSDFYTNQLPKSLILVYTGSFEAGEKGCFNRYEWDHFLQQYFLIKERVLMDSLFRTTIPEFETRLQAALFHPVKIDINWLSMFPVAIASDADKRLKIAEPLCGHHSAHVLLPIVDAIEEISAQSVEARTQLSCINRILVECVHESNATAQAFLESGDSVTGDSLPHSNWMTLHCVYPLAKTSGYFDFVEMKQFLRSGFKIPIPESEKGLNGFGEKLGSTTRKLGDELGKIGESLSTSVQKLLH